MTIPIGKDYIFTIIVLEPGTMMPLNVTGYVGTVSIFRQDNYADKPVSDVILAPTTGKEAQGHMWGVISGADTSSIVIADKDKGYPADGHYVIERYAGFISLEKFSHADINVSIPAISFVFAG